MSIIARFLLTLSAVLLAAFCFSDEDTLQITVTSDGYLDATDSTVRVTVYGYNIFMADVDATPILKFHKEIDSLPVEVNIPWPENAHELIDDPAYSLDEAVFWVKVWVDTDNDGYSCADDYNDVNHNWSITNEVNPEILDPMIIYVAQDHSGTCRTPLPENHPEIEYPDGLKLHLTSMIYHDIDLSTLHVSIYGYNQWWADTAATEIINVTRFINEIPKEVIIPWPENAHRLIENPPANTPEEAGYYAIAWVDTDNDGKRCYNDLSMDYANTDTFFFDESDVYQGPLTLFLAPGYHGICATQ